MSEYSDDRKGEIAELAIDIYELHDLVISKSGGLSGLRELGLLHAAAGRPFVTFGGQELYPTDLEKSAALFHSLIKNHPFMDGTKRTAFISAIFFLKSRGRTTPKNPPMARIIDFCLRVAEENLRIGLGESVTVLTIEDIAKWFGELLTAEPSES